MVETEGSTKAEESSEARGSEASWLGRLTCWCGQRSARPGGKCSLMSPERVLRVVPSADLENDQCDGAESSDQAPEGESFSRLGT